MMGSTLERPDEHLIRAFKPHFVGKDTVRTLLEGRYCLVICCKACPRMVEWTPPQLLERFGARLDLPLVELVPRLSCAGEGGCGSREVAVFPWAYALPWTWPPAEEPGHGAAD